MQSNGSEELHRVEKLKKVYNSVENFEKTLKVEQKVLRDAFGWFCSVYLPNTSDASASAIIEPYHSETKQVTIILKGEYVSPHSHFKSLIVRQKFNMSVEKDLSKGPNSLLTASTESMEYLHYYNTEDVNITIHQAKDEEGKIKKKSSFLDNVARLSEHMQRFYVKNYLNWVTGDKSSLVLALNKRHGEVASVFPTHYKNFEKCISPKINVIVKQKQLQMDLLEDNQNLAEVKRHEKLFDKHQKLQKYFKLQELLKPNYLRKHEEVEEFFVFSETSSDSDGEYYIMVDSLIETTLDGDSITEDEFIVIDNHDSVTQNFRETNSVTENNNFGPTEDFLPAEAKSVDFNTEASGSAVEDTNKSEEKKEEEKVDSKASGSAVEDTNKSEEKKEEDEVDAKESGSAVEDTNKCEEKIQEDEVDSKPKEENVQDKEDCGNVSNKELNLEDNVKSDSSDESETEELALVHARNVGDFLYYLHLFDEDHGTIYSKCTWTSVIHKNKIEGFHITNKDDFKAYIAYDEEMIRTNEFLEVHKELFKPKSSLLEKASNGVAKLKRRLKLKALRSPHGDASSSKAETEDPKTTPTSKKSFVDKVANGGKKFNVSFFGKREDRKKISLKKIFKLEGNSSNNDSSV